MNHQVRVMDNEYVKKVVLQHTKPGHSFEIPFGDNIVHMIGVSGGADSAVTALIFKAFYPDTPVIMLMTDTGEEVNGTKDTLTLIGQVTNSQVTIIEPEVSLFEYIERMGMFLPSQNARYCTTTFKILPYTHYLDSLKKTRRGDLRIASYIGLRADEPTRLGAAYSDNNIENYFPLRDLGLTKQDVFSILDKTIGIPEFYRFRSRSGCSTCPFNRRSEVIALSARDIRSFLKAASLEKLPDDVIDRLMELPKPLPLEIGIARNHLVYPKPENLLAHPNQKAIPLSNREHERSKLRKITSNDLFEQKSLFAATHICRYWCWDHWQVALEHFVVYSSSLAGLKKALKFYYLHLANTRILHGCMTEEELQSEHKIVMYEIALDHPQELFGLDLEDAFTWQSDRQPLLLIRKVVAVLEKILLSDNVGHPQRDGQVIWMGEYEPASEKALEQDPDVKEETTACYVCSR